MAPITQTDIMHTNEKLIIYGRLVASSDCSVVFEGPSLDCETAQLLPFPMDLLVLLQAAVIAFG